MNINSDSPYNEQGLFSFVLMWEAFGKVLSMSEPDDCGSLNYATPTKLVVREAMRAGPLLVVGQYPILPDVCVHCGAPGHSSRVPRSIVAETTFGLTGKLFSFRLMNVPPLRLDMPLCKKHFYRRKTAHGIGVVFVCVALLAAVYAVLNKQRPDDFELGICACVLTMIPAFVAALFEYGPSVKNVSDGYYYLKGCSPRFLNHLPTAGAMSAECAQKHATGSTPEKSSVCNSVFL